MSHKFSKNQKGYTITEIIIVILFIGILIPAMFTFFDGVMSGYIRLQEEGLSFSQLSGDSQKVNNVIRGLVDFKSTASELTNNPNELKLYAYFSPNDDKASLVRIYLSDNNTKLKVDVTPRTADYPYGTEVTDPNLVKHYTVVENFDKKKNLFEFLDENNNTITMNSSTPMNSIKNIKINLAAKKSKNSSESIDMSSIINLRNRKNNL